MQKTAEDEFDFLEAFCKMANAVAVIVRKVKPEKLTPLENEVVEEMISMQDSLVDYLNKTKIQKTYKPKR